MSLKLLLGQMREIAAGPDTDEKPESTDKMQNLPTKVILWLNSFGIHSFDDLKAEDQNEITEQYEGGKNADADNSWRGVYSSKDFVKTEAYDRISSYIIYFMQLGGHYFDTDLLD